MARFFNPLCIFLKCEKLGVSAIVQRINQFRNIASEIPFSQICQPLFCSAKEAVLVKPDCYPEKDK
jgi:hypothetical protein